MATNNFRPGAGRFASGNKFKGRASGGDSQHPRSSRDARSDREARPFDTDRPAREERGGRAERPGKFSSPDKKIFNRSERFTRSGEEGGPRPAGERSRSFERSAFKSGPKFTKPAPYQGNRRTGEGSGETGRQNEQRGDDRPRYGEKRNAEGSYAARGERKPYAAKGTYKPAGDKNREGGAYRPRENDGQTEGRPFKPYRAPAADRPAGERKPYDNAKPAGGRHGGRDDKRPFRSKAEAPAEAPNYDLKRFQSRERHSPEKNADSGLIRLNRYIANAGICSRREADNLIAAGEIKVNGEIITEMGYMVRPEDTVTYGKKRLNREKMVYVLLNKPKDFITTTEDPEGRKTVMDLVSKASKERIFPVGRLDRNTTGLLLFTNDGELAHKLTHPSNNISKIYQVELDKPITREHFEQIVNGVELEDGKAEVDDLALIGNSNTFLGIQIHIGKNRIARRIFEHLGYEVVSLDRVQYAGLTKKDVPRGQWRFLNEKEVIGSNTFYKSCPGMRNLAVDIGNTAIKYALFENDLLAYGGQVADEEELLGDSRLAQPDNLIVASVRSGPSRLLHRLPVKGRKLAFTFETPVPVTNGYETPQTLGADRLAAVIGASYLFPGTDCLVIDAGTAITIDFVDQHRHYHGGSIGPGLEMKFRALHTFTQKLPLIQRVPEPVPLAGRNTADAIRSGVLNGTVAELNGMIAAHRALAPHLKVVLCGGDAAFFETNLKAPIFVVPELVLIGLNRILNYNV